MVNLTDEILMSFADDALDDQTHRQVAQQIAGDPALARRLAVFQCTSAKHLAPVFAQVTDAEIPARLLNAASKIAPVANAAGRGHWESATGRHGVKRRLFGAPLIFTPTLSQALAMAASIAVIAGAVITSRHVAKPDGFRIALETAQSGTKIELPVREGHRAVVPLLSFKNKAGQFCRKYELVSERGHLNGIACRTETGGWQIDMETPAGPRPDDGQVVTAGNGEESSVDSRIAEIISGDALGRLEEDQALKRGWK